MIYNDDDPACNLVSCTVHKCSQIVLPTFLLLLGDTDYKGDLLMSHCSASCGYYLIITNKDHTSTLL